MKENAHPARKIAITPCVGVGQIYGPITREVGYNLVEDLYPDRTKLVCMPALAAEVIEDLDFIEDYPVVVLNGCKDRCATKVVEQKGGRVAAEVYLPDVLRAEKISLAGEARRHLGPKCQLAIAKMTERAGTIIDQYLGETAAVPQAANSVQAAQAAQVNLIAQEN